MNTIGERIRAKRKELGLTMKQLHELTSLSTGNISDMENNKYMPSLASLVPLSKALNCSIDWIVSGSESNLVRVSEQSTKENTLSCDGIPLSQNETDLVAMYRLLESRDQGTAFNFIEMLYKQTTGEQGSIYSTYTEEEKGHKKSDLKDTDQSSGIA